jgi:hypothetical protein
MSLTYQSPTIEAVGGDDYQVNSPVLFLAVAALVLVAAGVAAWWYAYVVEFQEVLIVSPP